MSRDRHRARAARLAAREAERDRRRRRSRRQAPWRRVRRRLRAGLRAPARRLGRRRPDIGRRPLRQRAGIAALFVAVQGAVWLLTPSWALRWLALLVGLLALPAAVVLVLDRRVR